MTREIRNGRANDGTSPPRDAGLGDLEHCVARVARVQDVAAFETLFAALAPLAKGFMIKGGADTATAEELAQEAMVRVWRKAPLYRVERGDVKAWFFTIVRNLRIDRIRRDHVWRLSEDLGAAHADLPASEGPADDRLHGVRRDAKVRDAVVGLPKDQREVIDMSFLEGLSHSEIAARLGIPLGTVKSRIRLAYESLRPGLANQL